MKKRISETANMLIVASLIALQGCVGAGTVTNHISSWDLGHENILGLGLCPASYDKKITGCTMDKIQEMTPKKVSTIWGDPKSDKNTNGYREIIYNQNIAWRGLIVFIGLPVPLLIPSGHNEARLLYKNDQLVHVDYTYGLMNAAVCGLHGEGPGGFGCIRGWH